MARGFASVHPSSKARLEAAGVKSWQVTQGWGYASASAGTHAPVGHYQGAKFGHCIDISMDYQPTREHFDALVEQGFAPFVRLWPGNKHWHIIDASGLPADNGRRPNHLGLVNSQLRDWCRGLNGLRDHGKVSPNWNPTEAQRQFIRDIWYKHRDFGAIRPRIIGPSGNEIDCGARIEGGSMVGRVAPILDALGVGRTWDGDEKTLYLEGE